MRQIFSSPRLENVEGVVKLLTDAGIAVRVTHGRTYEGGRRRRFSYTDSESPQPAVWVVNSADQVRAREMLRDAGLLDTTRPGDSYAAKAFRFDPLTQRVKPQKRALLAKVALLVGICVVLGLVVMRALTLPAVPQLAQPPFDGTVRPALLPVARAVFASQLAEVDLPVLCLSVDGADAPAPVVAYVQSLADARPAAAGKLPAKPAQQIVPLSQCERVADADRGSYHRASGREASILDVTAFRPSAPEAGQVQFSAYHHRMWARYKTLEVKRIDDAWQVTRVLKHVAT